MNPAPDADINSVGEDNFHWIVDNVAELAVRKAKEHTGKVSEYRWSTFLAGQHRRDCRKQANDVKVPKSATKG